MITTLLHIHEPLPLHTGNFQVAARLHTSLSTCRTASATNLQKDFLLRLGCFGVGPFHKASHNTRYACMASPCGYVSQPLDLIQSQRYDLCLHSVLRPPLI